jgi:hypothetical protein
MVIDLIPLLLMHHRCVLVVQVTFPGAGYKKVAFSRGMSVVEARDMLAEKHNNTPVCHWLLASHLVPLCDCRSLLMLR